MIETLFLPRQSLQLTMSSPLTTQLPTDVATSPSSTNLASNPSSSQPAPSSSLSPTAGQALPPDSQELSYFSSNPIEHSQPNDGPSTSTGRPTGGRCYSRDELFHLKKSPLVAPPPGMPHRKDWFGYVFSLITRQLGLTASPANLMSRQANPRTTMA